MPVLHLGVEDIPYVTKPRPGQNKVTAGTVTTGDVAGWLEDDYHIMEIFAHVHEQDIARDLENGLGGALESLLMGAGAQQFVGDNANLRWQGVVAANN